MQDMLLAVSAPPFWHSGRTLTKHMLLIVAALLPAAILAGLQWGMPALRVMALSVATAVICESLACLAAKHRQSITDYNAVVIGLLFAFLLPASAPWWLVVIGAAISVLFGKMLFGGAGASPLCAPVVGWAVLFLSWPMLMDPYTALLSTNLPDPLSTLKYLGLDAARQIPLLDLLLGKQVGALGASQPLALLAGGLFLCAARVIRWEIPLSFLVGVAATAFIFQAVNPELYASPAFHLLTGSTILGAFFLATDYSSSPNRTPAMLIYGLVGGVMVMLIRNFGVYPDGVPFAILLINLLMPQLELIRPKPFGAR